MERSSPQLGGEMKTIFIRRHTPNEIKSLAREISIYWFIALQGTRPKYLRGRGTLYGDNLTPIRESIQKTAQEIQGHLAGKGEMDSPRSPVSSSQTEAPIVTP